MVLLKPSCNQIEKKTKKEIEKHKKVNEEIKQDRKKQTREVPGSNPVADQPG